MTPHDPSPPPMPGLPPFAAVFAPPVDPRPGVVRGLCIVGFILAGMALVSPLGALATLLAPQPAFGPPGTTAPAVAVQRAMVDGPVLPWAIALHAGNLASGVWLLWSSIAAWRLREAGRRSMLAYAGVAIGWSIFAGAILGLVMMPAMFEALDAAGPRGAPVAPPVIVRGIGAAIGLVTAGFGMIYPICLLVLLRRPHVRAAFGNAAVSGR